MTGKYLKDLEEGVVTRFTDKSPNYPLERVRKMFYDPYATEKNIESLKKVQLIAEELNCKLVHLVLAWTIKLPYINSALIGARNSAQLEDSLEALKILPLLTANVEERISQALGNTPLLRMDCIKWEPHASIRSTIA